MIGVAVWAAEDKDWTKKNAIQSQSPEDYENQWNDNTDDDGWMSNGPDDDWMPNDGRSRLFKRGVINEFFTCIIQ